MLAIYIMYKLLLAISCILSIEILLAIVYNKTIEKEQKTDRTRKEARTMTKTLRMWYYLPGQSELFSNPQVFETNDGKEWERAVNIAHEKGYKIVKVERVK